MYAATTNTASNKNNNDDQNKPRIDIPGIGGSGSLLLGAGSIETINNGSTIGLGTTVSNPKDIMNKTSIMLVDGSGSTVEEKFAEQVGAYVANHSTTVPYSDGTSTEYVTEKTVALAFLKGPSTQSGVVNRATIQKFYLASKAKGIKLQWHGKK